MVNSGPKSLRVDPTTLTTFMEAALIEAEQAGAIGEVPVGAVVVKEGEIVGRGHNLVESNGVVTRHAEILAIEDASRTLGNFRLTHCTLYVTLEPCPMCAGAILLARLPTIVFGAPDPRFGAFGSRYDLGLGNPFGSPPRVIADILAERSNSLLRGFFDQLRG